MNSTQKRHANFYLCVCVCMCARAKENLMISNMPLSLMPYAKLHARHEMRDYISLTGYLSISLWSVIKSPWDEEVCTE